MPARCCRCPRREVGAGWSEPYPEKPEIPVDRPKSVGISSDGSVAQSWTCVLLKAGRCRLMRERGQWPLDRGIAATAAHLAAVRAPTRRSAPPRRRSMTVERRGNRRPTWASASRMSRMIASSGAERKARRAEDITGTPTPSPTVRFAGVPAVVAVQPRIRVTALRSACRADARQHREKQQARSLPGRRPSTPWDPGTCRRPRSRREARSRSISRQLRWPCRPASGVAQLPRLRAHLRPIVCRIKCESA